MKRVLIAFSASLLVILGTWTVADATSTFITGQGGTGTSSPSGILFGDNGATSHLNTVIIGSNLTFSGGTLSATGGGGGGSGNVATSTSETAGQLAYWTSTGATPATLGKVATTTVTCAGSTSCTSFVAIGPSPITITGGGISDPFTHVSVWGQTTSATSTLIALTGSPYALVASSTSVFQSASTTYFSITGLTGPSGLGISANGQVYAAASTTFTGSGPISLSYSNGQVTGSCSTCNTSNATVSSVATNNGLTGGTITTTGTIGLATINAGVLGAVKNGDLPTSQATSTLYGSWTNGMMLAFSGSNLIGVATTTAGTGLTNTEGAGTNTFSVNSSQSIATLSNLTNNGFVYTSGGGGTLNVGTFSADTIPFITHAGTGIGYTASSSLLGVGTLGQVWGYTSTGGAWVATSSSGGGGGGAFPFTPATNFGVNTSGTTTPIWAQGNPISLMASSTAWFDQINIGSTTAGLMSTSTDYGNWAVTGNSSTTNLTVTNNTWLPFLATGASRFLTINATGQIGTVALQLSVANGGTGQTSFASNTIITANAAGTGMTATSSEPLWVGAINATSTTNKSGISTSTPWGQFSINPIQQFGANPGFVVGSSSGTSFIVDNRGYVGIGTTTPFALLSIFTSSSTNNTLPGPRTLFAIGSSSTGGVATTTFFTVSNIGSTSLTMIPSGQALYSDSNKNIVGTSTANVTASGVLSLSQPIVGFGTANANLTLTGGTNGQALAWAAGIPTWVATSTNSCSGVSCSYNTGTWTFSIANNAITTGLLATLAANSVLGNSTGGTANVAAIATSSLYTFSSSFNAGTNLLQGVSYFTFTVSTSTTWTGTTTIPLGPAYVGETWNGIMCFTDAGTLNVDVYYAATHMTLLNASTTVGTFNWASNNTPAATNARKVDIGTPASSPHTISCTVKKTI